MRFKQTSDKSIQPTVNWQHPHNCCRLRRRLVTLNFWNCCFFEWMRIRWLCYAQPVEKSANTGLFVKSILGHSFTCYMVLQFGCTVAIWLVSSVPQCLLVANFCHCDTRSRTSRYFLFQYTIHGNAIHGWSGVRFKQTAEAVFRICQRLESYKRFATVQLHCNVICGLVKVATLSSSNWQSFRLLLGPLDLFACTTCFSTLLSTSYRRFWIWIQTDRFINRIRAPILLNDRQLATQSGHARATDWLTSLPNSNSKETFSLRNNSMTLKLGRTKPTANAKQSIAELSINK